MRLARSTGGILGMRLARCWVQEGSWECDWPGVGYRRDPGNETGQVWGTGGILGMRLARCGIKEGSWE